MNTPRTSLLVAAGLLFSLGGMATASAWDGCRGPYCHRRVVVRTYPAPVAYGYYRPHYRVHHRAYYVAPGVVVVPRHHHPYYYHHRVWR